MVKNDKCVARVKKEVENDFNAENEILDVLDIERTKNIYTRLSGSR